MQIVPFDDLFLAAKLQFSHCLQCMPQCVAFEFWLLWRRLREAVHVERNSTRGRHVALGPPKKAGNLTF